MSRSTTLILKVSVLSDREEYSTRYRELVICWIKSPAYVLRLYHSTKGHWVKKPDLTSIWCSIPINKSRPTKHQICQFDRIATAILHPGIWSAARKQTSLCEFDQIKEFDQIGCLVVFWLIWHYGLICGCQWYVYRTTICIMNHYSRSYVEPARPSHRSISLIMLMYGTRV